LGSVGAHVCERWRVGEEKRGERSNKASLIEKGRRTKVETNPK
jgi:hypothetical protein